MQIYRPYITSIPLPYELSYLFRMILNSHLDTQLRVRHPSLLGDSWPNQSKPYREALRTNSLLPVEQNLMQLLRQVKHLCRVIMAIGQEDLLLSQSKPSNQAIEDLIQLLKLLGRSSHHNISPWPREGLNLNS